MIGTRTANELRTRGHDVVVATRGTGSDITSAQSVREVVAGADAVVCSISAKDASFTYVDAARALVDGMRASGVRRVVVVGGAGSLEVAPGVRLLDSPDFPAEWKDDALELAAALEYYRAIDDIDWTFVSPAAVIEPGERTGRYRLGGDQLLSDHSGESKISAEDFAVAIADLVENGQHVRARVGAAW
jgi:putative NADH-flavin reductase